MLFSKKFMDGCDDRLKAERIANKTGASKYDILRSLEKARREEKRRKTANDIAAGVI